MIVFNLFIAANDRAEDHREDHSENRPGHRSEDCSKDRALHYQRTGCEVTQETASLMSSITEIL